MSLPSRLLRIKCSDLQDEQILKIVSLIEATWPELERSESDEDRIIRYREENKSREVFLIESDGTLAGHTKIFPRVIRCQHKSFPITALSGVCVPDRFRGHHFGKRMVREVFDLVDRGKLPACLFQTNIPSFYKKLGARVIHNRFYNSREPSGAKTSPWFEPFVMIYSRGKDWPEGDIDLNGPAF